MEQISYDIIHLLTKNNIHAREISNILKINHMTVSRKLKDLEKENILDYRQEGKNKIYFIKETIESDINLKMLEHNKVIQLIKKHPRFRKILSSIENVNINLAIIFGSYAKNSDTKNSDIDLYIDSSDKEVKKKLELIDSKLSVKNGKFYKQSLLGKEIIKDHIILKGVDEYYELISKKNSKGE